MLYHLGYASTAVQAMQRDDLVAILDVARRVNKDNDITGLLLYQDGNFLQVLEGSEAAVRATFARIAEDGRHRDVAVMFSEPVEDRLFSDWSMGFQSLDGSELLEFPRADGKPPGLREMSRDIAKAKQLLLVMRRRGLDPAKDVATAG